MVQMSKQSNSSSPPSRLRRRSRTTNTFVTHRTPPLAAVLVAIAILAGSIVLTFRARSHRSVDSSASDSLKKQHSILGNASSLFRQTKTSGATTQSFLNWCQSSECTNRLEELRSKLALEDEIYREQYERERHRKRVFETAGRSQYRHYTRQEIVQSHVRQIQKDWHESIEENPDADYYPRSALEPKTEWITHGSFPEINVIGNLKTGTSQLFNIFATHVDTVDIPGEWKEHCSDDHYGDDDEVEGTPRDTYQYVLHAWHEFYFNHKAPAGGSQKKQVNGCIGLVDLERRIVYNPPTPGTKFFVLLRDPADWAWAAYNFWTDDGWDTNTVIHDEDSNHWVKDARTQYRSPEAFHEAILAGELTVITERYTNLRRTSVEMLRRMTALVGKENLIVLKNEDLFPSRIHESGLLQRLVDATGLSINGFDENVLHSRSNCNANKGYLVTCSDDEREHGPSKTNSSQKTAKKNQSQKQKNQEKHAKNKKRDDDLMDVESNLTEIQRLLQSTGSDDNDSVAQPQQRHEQKQEEQHSFSRTVGYPVTHYRPMLESTRRFIYLQWHKECKIWAEEFGVEYPECLAAFPDADESNNRY